MADTTDMTGAANAVNAVKDKQVEVPAATETAPSTTVDDAFARKERQLRKLQKEIEMREQQLKAKESQYTTDYVPKTELSKYISKDRFTEDPLSAFADAGFDQDKLVQLLTSGHNTQDPVMKQMRAEIKSLRDRQEQDALRSAEAAKQQEAWARKQIASEVTMLIDSDPAYETIKASGAQEAVTELIEQTFNESGTLLDTAEAARQIEEYLIEEAFKLAQTSKVKARLAPKAPEVPVSTLNTKAATPLKTLTNVVTASQSTKGLSNKEKRERAIAAFHGKLNQ